MHREASWYKNGGRERSCKAFTGRSRKAAVTGEDAFRPIESGAQAFFSYPVFSVWTSNHKPVTKPKTHVVSRRVRP